MSNFASEFERRVGFSQWSEGRSRAPATRGPRPRRRGSSRGDAPSDVPVAIRPVPAPGHPARCGGRDGPWTRRACRHRARHVRPHSSGRSIDGHGRARRVRLLVVVTRGPGLRSPHCEQHASVLPPRRAGGVEPLAIEVHAERLSTPLVTPGDDRAAGAVRDEQRRTLVECLMAHEHRPPELVAPCVHACRDDVVAGRPLKREAARIAPPSPSETDAGSTQGDPENPTGDCRPFVCQSWAAPASLRTRTNSAARSPSAEGSP